MRIRNVIQIIVLSSTIRIVLALTPTCDSLQPPPLIPLSLGETLQIGLDTIFTGNNLQFSLLANSSTTKINKKIEETDSKNFSFPNLIHHYVEENENQWGRQSVILYRNGTKTYVTFGIYSQDSLKDFSSTVLVSDDENMSCFSSVLFPQQNVIIVDCSKHILEAFSNYFFYIDTQKKSVIKTVPNSMFYYFQIMTKRETLKIKSFQDGKQYYVRSYITAGVDFVQSGSVFVQIFLAKDPLNLVILKLVDKYFLGQKQLNITMIKQNKGNLYLLDGTLGLYKISISESSITAVNKFSKYGLVNFDIYSESFKKTKAVLANEEVVYEVQWQDEKGVLVNKFTLLGLGEIKNVLINHEFIIVQTNTSNSSSIQIFRKGISIYANSFTFMANFSSKMLSSFNKNSDILIVVSDLKIFLYRLSLPKVTCQLDKSGREGTYENITIIAQSKWINSSMGEKCEAKFQLKFVSSNDQIMLKSNYPTTKKYFKNQLRSQAHLQINLNNYFYGANITYDITQETSSSSKHFFELVNKEKIDFTSKKLLQNISLLFTSSPYPESRYVYTQTSDHFLNVILCQYIPDEMSQSCQLDYKVDFTSQITAITMMQSLKYAAMEKNKKNEITIVEKDSFTFRKVSIKYETNKEVTGIAANEGFLFVLRSSDSVIDVYNSYDCFTTSCKIWFQIDITSLSKYELNPLQIVTDKNSSNLIFLKYPKSILIIDASKITANRLIAEISTKQTLSSSFTFLISNNKLVIISSPNIVSVYSLDIIMRGQVVEQRKLSLYGNNFQSIENIHCSSKQNGLLYIPIANTINNSSTILIYKLNQPTTISLYSYLNLPKNVSPSKLKLTVYSQLDDDLLISTGTQFLSYRIYNLPKAVFTSNVPQTFKFAFSNSYSKQTEVSETLEIESTATHLNFKRTKDFDNFVSGIDLSKPGNYLWDDQKWFTGNILDYNFTCNQCNGTSEAKVAFRSHAGSLKKMNFKAISFFQNEKGTVLIENQTLYKLNRDFTVREKLALPPLTILSKYVKVVSTPSEDVIISAVNQIGSGISFVFTVKVSSHSMNFGPFKSSAYRIQKMEIVGDLLMLFDSSSIPQFKLYKNAIYFFDYTMAGTKDGSIEQIYFINEDDLKNAIGYNRDRAFLSSCELVKLEANNYRLYVLEVDGGLFIVDFSYKDGQKNITISRVVFQDLNILMEQNNLYLPTDSSTTSLNFVQLWSVGQTTYHSLLVGCQHFDNFIIAIGFDTNYKLVKRELKSILYRYGNYSVSSISKVSGNFAGFIYDSPSFIEDKTKQLIAIYDISNISLQQSSYSKKYMIGSIRQNQNVNVGIDFSLNFTQIKETKGKSTSVIFWNYQQTQPLILQQTISRYLELQLKAGYKAGNFTLIPWIDGQSQKINLPMTVNQAFLFKFMKTNIRKQIMIDE